MRTDDQQTIIGYTRTTGIVLFGVLGGLGFFIGYFLPQIATWALTLPWVPFQGPLKLIHFFQGDWIHIVLAIIGLIAGIVLAFIAKREILILKITDQEVKLEIKEQVQTLLKNEIAAIFPDGKQLVFLGKSGYELARENNDESLKKVEEAFRFHDYPWSGMGDPFKEEYHRWIPDTSDLSPTVNAILRAREKALQEKKEEDIKDFRLELAKLGYIIRDEKTRQFWRPVIKDTSNKED